MPIEASAWQRLRLLLNRSPDNARIKNKMMYASTKDFFKSYLEVRPAVERHGVSELCNIGCVDPTRRAWQRCCIWLPPG